MKTDRCSSISDTRSSLRFTMWRRGRSSPRRWRIRTDRDTEPWQACSLGADVIICGGIGGGAVQALTAAGIQLYAGVSGDADQAVEELLAGKLSPNAEANCDHHGHGEGHHDCKGHGEGHHGCGGHGEGHHGCGH